MAVVATDAGRGGTKLRRAPGSVAGRPPRDLLVPLGQTGRRGKVNAAFAGCQHLDGGQALAVARARHYRYLQGGRWHTDPLSDLGRIQRQQTFLRVVLQTAIAKGLTNPVRANQFAGAVVGSLTKDSYLTVAGAVGLARQFHGFNAAGLRTQTLPTVAADHYQGFGDVLLLKQPDVGRAVDSFLDRPPPSTTATPATAGAPARAFDPRPC